MPKTCEECKHWINDVGDKYPAEEHEGVCARIGLHRGLRARLKNARAVDDYGYQAYFVTGPQFGCTLFEAKGGGV